MKNVINRGALIFYYSKSNWKINTLAMLTFATLVTLTRLFLIAPVVVCYLTPFTYHQIIAASFFALASALDWYDGYAARSRKEVTILGAALDHTVDKILILLVLIAIIYETHNIIITICSMVILTRELLISALREYTTDEDQRAQVKVGWLGKLKTALQMLTVLLILASEPIALPIVIGEILMVIATAVSLISAWNYLPRKKITIYNNNKG